MSCKIMESAIKLKGKRNRIMYSRALNRQDTRDRLRKQALCPYGSVQAHPNFRASKIMSLSAYYMLTQNMRTYVVQLATLLR